MKVSLRKTYSTWIVCVFTLFYRSDNDHDRPLLLRRDVVSRNECSSSTPNRSYVVLRYIKEKGVFIVIPNRSEI